jgi:hypothetical protein
MMKKALLLVAGVMTATSAQAADLSAPAAEAVDYVRVCDAYGKGFFYIPGTETCLRIGGYVRVDAYASLSEDNGGLAGGLGWDDRDEGIAARARARVEFEAINNTDFGPLQSFIAIHSQLDTRSGNATTVDRAWIKWAGFTFGWHDSFFTFMGGGADVLLASVAGPDDANVVWAYTAAFGNGISASLSFEAPVTTRQGGTFWADADGDGLRDANELFPAYGGTRWPDVVANVKVSQAWGSAQIMGALHHAYSSDAFFAFTGNNVDEVGYAIGAGVKVNIPGLGAASDFGIQAAYSKGAVKYVDPSSPFNDFNNAGNLTTAWGVAAALNLGFTSQVSAGLSASYGYYENTGARANVWTAMGDVTFRPVSGLQFRTGLEYRNEDFNVVGADRSELVGFFRVQRSF